MVDEMGNYQNFQNVSTITKVEMESLGLVDEKKKNAGNGNVDETSSSRLPPGFRFHPTDEELVSYYLTKKVENKHYNFDAIDEVNLNKCEPWDLPPKAKVSENAWYFFSLRDRKYPTGMRTNRATEAGYWKATGKDREVMSSVTDKLVGMKKTLVFYLGRAPKGEKTNWIMHEYRIEGESSLVTEWVVCRVFKKNAAPAAASKKSAEGHDHPGGSHYQLELEDNESSYDQQSSTYLPPLTDSPNHHQSQSHVLSSHIASGYNGAASNPSSSGEYHPHHHHQQQGGAGGAYQNEHGLLQPLPNSRTFNMNDFHSNNFSTNWAVRREMQGVGNTIESLVSGIGNWDTVVPMYMPSSSSTAADAVWPIWDSPSG